MYQVHLRFGNNNNAVRSFRYIRAQWNIVHAVINHGPAEPGYALALKKPADLDLHHLSLSMWIYRINNQDQVIRLAENEKWA